MYFKIVIVGPSKMLAPAGGNGEELNAFIAQNNGLGAFQDLLNTSKLFNVLWLVGLPVLNPDVPNYGQIRPAIPMNVGTFRALIQSTAPAWQPVK